ncbi:MAG: hypothetical protein CL947_03060 [Epsilonproteobacteria bacterium]|nr:hypothetical protein [Campylobacterota bacterium]|tara:strand:- start:529 stop:999 length:471 start_codon:yes stop_codon:yes gene_type:complete
MKKNILLTIMLVANITSTGFLKTSDNKSDLKQVVKDFQNQRKEQRNQKNESMNTKINKFIEDNPGKTAISTISGITLGLAARSAFDDNPVESFAIRNVAFYGGTVISALGYELVKEGDKEHDLLTPFLTTTGALMLTAGASMTIASGVAPLKDLKK